MKVANLKNFMQVNHKLDERYLITQIAWLWLQQLLLKQDI